MKKMNQKSINKIIFYKLFENTNNSIQNTTLDSSKVSDTSMSSMNPLPLKSDNPLRAWGDDEMDEYYRWLEKQMDEWELANPRPKWVDGMSQEEWEALMQLWQWYYNEHRYGLEHWYSWNFPGTNDTIPGQIPQRNPLPKPKEREPTWSPRPDWAPPYLPGWWHIGPNETGPV